MSVETAIADLQAKVGALSGIKAAPEKPPEAANQFPFAVSYERTGRLANWSDRFGDELVTIYTEIHLTRQLLPQAVAAALTYRDPFVKAVMADPQLSGAVSTVNEIRWTFGSLTWGGVETIGYRFEVDMKVSITV